MVQFLFIFGPGPSPDFISFESESGIHPCSPDPQHNVENLLQKLAPEIYIFEPLMMKIHQMQIKMQKDHWQLEIVSPIFGYNYTFTFISWQKCMDFISP